MLRSNRIAVLFIVFLSFLVFYFSWKASPDFTGSWYMPSWLAHWADKHGQLRTGVPFLLLGMVIIALSERGLSRAGYWLVWCGLVGVVVLAEVGQLFLPRRHFDGMDIIWGSVGAALGLGVGIAVRRLLSKGR